MKKCHKCKIEKDLPNYFNNKTRSDGKHHWCKDCMKIDRIRYVKENPEKIKALAKKTNGYLNTRFLQLVRGAKNRNLVLEITKESLQDLIQLNCFYCNGQLNKYGHGLDRYDNNKGYTKENSVPCCAICNKMKSTLNGDDFIAQVNKITKHKKGALFLP